MAISASARFARQYRALVRAEAKIGKVLDGRAATWLRKANVLGYGVGHKAGMLAAVFFVRKKVKRANLAPKDRLPRFILVDGKRVPTDVVRTRPPRYHAEAIGDSTDNRQSYHTDGTGAWQMGVGISVWERPHPYDPADNVGEGTAGARVLSKQASDPVPKVLSCAHLLKQASLEVAQLNQTKSTAPGFLNNMVGAVSKVSQDQAYADAGLIECVDAEREIMHIGLPRPVQMPFVGLYVMKSGYTTGLTWSRVTATNTTTRIKGETEVSTGMFRIDGTCKQDPAGPGKVSTRVPPDRFDWYGDSGSLIVIGRANVPGQWGDAGLQKTYDDADDAEKAVIRDTWERAALGLLCAGDDKSTLGQYLSRALTTLDVKLDI